MRAVVYAKNGTPDPLTLQEVAKPVPKENEVLIRVHATAVNAYDYRSMELGILPRSRIFGTDIAGRIESVGSGCKLFGIGDDVFGDLSGCGCGGFAEYVAAPEALLAAKPSALSYEIAASVPMAAVTALQALRDKGNIQPGQKVLLCGTGGGVGTFAVQLAKHFGAEVTAVCSTRNVGLMESLGADHIIDYSKEDFAANGKKYDLIVAVNGNRSLSTYKNALTPKGVYVVIGGAYSQIFKSLILGPFMSLGGKKMRFLASKPRAKDLEFVIKLVESGKVKPIIDSLYPLHGTAKALKHLHEGHAQGKVIISIVNSDVE